MAHSVSYFGIVPTGIMFGVVSLGPSIDVGATVLGPVYLELAGIAISISAVNVCQLGHYREASLGYRSKHICIHKGPNRKRNIKRSRQLFARR